MKGLDIKRFGSSTLVAKGRGPRARPLGPLPSSQASMSDADPASEQFDVEGAPSEPKGKCYYLCKVCKVVFIVPILVYRLLCALGRGLCRVWHCICNCCICRYTRQCCRWACRKLCCYNPVPFKWDENAARVFTSVGLTDAEVKELARSFAKVDADRSGQVEVMEFCDYLNFEPTPFALRVFSLMDADASGELDFVEFVLAVWNYCSFGSERLRRFAFDLYDNDHSGSLDTKEVRAGTHARARSRGDESRGG